MKFFPFSVFWVGQEIQAMDHPCRMWRKGCVKELDSKNAYISFAGIDIKSQRECWVKIDDVRYPEQERVLYTRHLPTPRQTLINILKECCTPVVRCIDQAELARLALCLRRALAGYATIFSPSWLARLACKMATSVREHRGYVC